MYRNGKSLSVLFVSTLLGMLLPSLASALGTPDGLPPPMEHVCDAEKGAAYGSCNAYCQAMDCDSATPSASATACQKVSDKFMQVTGRSIPCSELCPLYLNDNFPSFNEVVSTPSSITSCAYNYNGDPRSLIVYGASPALGTVWYSPAGGSISFGGDEGGQVPLDIDEYASCKGLLEDAVMMSGVTCTGQ